MIIYDDKLYIKGFIKFNNNQRCCVFYLYFSLFSFDLIFLIRFHENVRGVSRVSVTWLRYSKVCVKAKETTVRRLVVHPRNTIHVCNRCIKKPLVYQPCSFNVFNEVGKVQYLKSLHYDRNIH
jgi:hypothetical protein